MSCDPYTATVDLLRAMVEHGVNRIVFSSTCATFGSPERVPIDELMPQNPINPYGESKLIFERILHWFHRIHHLAFVTLRYFNVAGASEKYGEDHKTETPLIPRILRVALGQSHHAEIFGTDFETPDGTCIRDYVHVRDIASAHLLALSAEGSDSFDALSRCYSYVLQKPWSYIWYAAVALVYGAIVVFFVGLMGSLMALGTQNVSQKSITY